MKFFTIQSGSSGNSTYIGCNNYGILIDAGAGIRVTAAALERAGTDLKHICAVFVTHEHSDHIKNLASITKKHRIPVFANKKTLQSILSICPSCDDSLFHEMETGKSAQGGDIIVSSFKTSHDSAESVGYTIKAGDCQISTVTDLGCMTDDILDCIYKSKLVLLESNHDKQMLMTGGYPYFLKKRILSDRGHLSNDDCAEAALKLVRSGVNNIILGHLSSENNTPDIAFETTKEYLEENGIKINRDITLITAPRLEPSDIFNI